MAWRTTLGIFGILFCAGGCAWVIGAEEGKLRDCRLADEACFCGDGELSSQVGEGCDDGNTENFDGCSANCKREVVTSIVAGAFHSCALITGGAVKCWGRNDYGQLGVGDRKNRGDEPNEMGNQLPVVSLGKGRSATALAAGEFHTCVLLDDGSVKCWGLNGIGQLGLGDTKTRGDDPNEMGDALPVVDLGTGKTAKSIAAGAYHTCVLLSDSGVKCWGANASGQLGVGDVTPRGRLPNQMSETLPTVDLGTGVEVSSISAGDYFTCAVISNGGVKCWGDNAVGQLGQGDTWDRGDQLNEIGDALDAMVLANGAVVESVSLGSAHVCALILNRGAKCWGGNWQGQLGLGDVLPRGKTMGPIGNALPFVDLGMSKGVVAGHAHTCALLMGGDVKCWGWNQYGQLGIGDPLSRGDQPGEMGSALDSVELGQKATMVAAGDTHTCALLEEGRVKCWGGNTYGQLGIGGTNHDGDEAGEILPSETLLLGDAVVMP